MLSKARPTRQEKLACQCTYNPCVKCPSLTCSLTNHGCVSHSSSPVGLIWLWKQQFLHHASPSMAELGVIASIIALAGSGIKVSIVLFDLADRIGSAGDEVRLLATEVTLFCSVLQAVQIALEDPSGSHYTPAALQLVDQLVRHCISVINEIDNIISSLVKEEGTSDFPSLEWTGRVRWTFRRSKVQVKRQTLESCKNTLHLLLTTLRWSRRFSSHR